MSPEESDQEHARLLVASEHWIWARAKLNAIIDATISLGTIDDKATATAIKNELILRKRCLAILNTWLEEVEGAANQHKFNPIPQKTQGFVHIDE